MSSLTPEGTYYALIKDSVATQSSPTNPQIAIKCNITMQAGATDWIEIAPLERTIFIHLSKKAQKYSKPKLQKLQFNGHFESPAFGVQGMAVTCKHDLYENKLREKWELVDDGPGGFEPEPLDQNAAYQLNAWWQAEQAVAPPVPVAAPPVAPPVAPSPLPVASPMAAVPPAPPMPMQAPMPAPAAPAGMPVPVPIPPSTAAAPIPMIPPPPPQQAAPPADTERPPWG